MRIAIALLTAGFAIAQTQPASVVYSVKNGEQTVEIANVVYQLISQRLLLRTTTRTNKVIGDIGMEASTTVEAWPLGVDPKQKPLYTIKVAGVDARTVDGALLVIARGLEDSEWWSVYKLGTGERLFDTYVPLLGFSLRRDIQTMRYVGFDAATTEKDPHLVGVLTYASTERVLREALITSDDPKQARMLRSLADASRAVMLVETPARALKISISQNYPSAPATVTLTVPIVADDLDLTHAQMPEHLHVQKH